MKSKHICITIFLLIGFTILFTQDVYQPAKENLAAREWFRNASFGMFIHWGVYSVLADGEWVMQVKKIDKKTYEKLPSFFNPIEYNPAEWVSLAREAGMKYIVITSKHHDGFAMFDSKLTDWNIVDRTFYKKDVLKMLADECHKQGIKLFFYYSQLDWYQDNYYPRGWTGHSANRPDKGDWFAYLDYMDGQLKELLTHYGEISGIWFDGWWDKKEADWRLAKTYKLIHDAQPQCLIGSNHHQAPNPGEDFQMFEKDLPGKNTAGFSGESRVGELPLETCETINGSWGFNVLDNRYKSAKELIHYLVKAAGYNANFLLNVGPMPNGKIQQEFADTLKVVGQWLAQYGESIYGTRGGPVTPREWGVTTQKGNKVYIHILNWQDPSIVLPKMGENVASVAMFPDKKRVHFLENEFGITLALPEETRNRVDTVLEIELGE
jgi:alpha-L-fucosidase